MPAKISYLNKIIINSKLKTLKDNLFLMVNQVKEKHKNHFQGKSIQC